MPSRFRRAALAPFVSVVLFFFASVATAQTKTPGGSDYTLTAGMNEFGVWGGGSPDSVLLAGNVPDTSLVLVGLRYGRVLAAGNSVSLEYTLDILPAAFVFAPDHIRRAGSTIYGAGLSPLGFKVNFGQEGWIKPFIAAGVGFLYFEKDVPVRGSSRFNFSPEVGLGIQFFLKPKQALTVGYKFHHLSNAGASRTNPGLDSNVFYAGFSFFTP